MATEVKSATAAIAVAQGGIEAAESVLGLYNQIAEKVIPWKTFEEIIEHLNKTKDQYSSEAAKLVGDVQTLFLDAKDDYNASVESVVRWCRTSSTLLAQYLVLFEKITDPGIAVAQKILIVKVLSEGHDAMEKATESLQKSSGSFNDAYGKLTTLQKQLELDFDKESEFFNNAVDKVRTEAYAGAAAGAILGPIGLAISYSIAAGVVEGKLIPELEKAFEETKTYFQNLTTDLEDTLKKIEEAKANIVAEIKVIGKISSQIDTTTTFAEIWAASPVALFAPLKQQTQTLIDMCNQYVEAKE
jgi:hemolysin E